MYEEKCLSLSTFQKARRRPFMMSRQICRWLTCPSPMLLRTLPARWESVPNMALLTDLNPGSHAKSCNKSISSSTKMCEPDSLESGIKKEYEYYEPDNCFHNKQTFSKHCPQEGRFEWACQSKPKLHRPSEWSTLDFFVFWVFESTEK